MTDVTAALVDFSLTLDDRTSVRPLRLGDADELFALIEANRRHLSEWLKWPPDVTELEHVIEHLRDSERDALEHRAFLTGIFEDGRLAGALELYDIDWLNAHAKIGYWLDKEHCGRGIMSSAVRALVDYTFEALYLNRIEIRTATANHRSRHLAERLGFELEGVFRQGVRLHDEFVDYAVYATLRDEWHGGEGA